MFEKVIHEWKANLATLLSFSKDTHERAEPLWEEYDDVVDAYNQDVMMEDEFTDKKGEVDAKLNKLFAKAPKQKASTEITIAIGWFADARKLKFLVAKQKAPAPTYIGGVYPPPGYTGESLVDAHQILMDYDSTWYSEKTGVHAEAMIIRAWLLDLGQTDESGLSALSNKSVIVASQPACWCCAALMTQYKIAYPGDAGKKPKTGWRHPLCHRTVPNDKIPKAASDITTSWLDKAKGYAGSY